MTLCNDDDSKKSYHVKSYHVNAYLNKILGEQSLADFHRHMQHIENQIKHYDTSNRNDDIIKSSKVVNYL